MPEPPNVFVVTLALFPAIARSGPPLIDAGRGMMNRDRPALKVSAFRRC
jgi:hypothetical protein